MTTSSTEKESRQEEKDRVWLEETRRLMKELEEAAARTERSRIRLEVLRELEQRER